MSATSAASYSKPKNSRPVRPISITSCSASCVRRADSGSVSAPPAPAPASCWSGGLLQPFAQYPGHRMHRIGVSVMGQQLPQMVRHVGIVRDTERPVQKYRPAFAKADPLDPVGFEYQTPGVDGQTTLIHRQTNILSALCIVLLLRCTGKPLLHQDLRKNPLRPPGRVPEKPSLAGNATAGGGRWCQSLSSQTTACGHP